MHSFSKFAVAFIVAISFSFIACKSKTEKPSIAGKWKCIRVDKSLSKKEHFAEYRKSSMYGIIFEFGKVNVLNIIQENDSSSHYYTISDDNKFLMYEMLGNVAGFHKIIEFNQDSFKLAINFDDTLVFSKTK